MEELITCYNEFGTPEQILSKSEAIKSGKYIQACQLWLIDSKNNILLEQRSKKEEQDPNLIDLCSGHVETGENPRNTIKRETIEEIDLDRVLTKQELDSIKRFYSYRVGTSIQKLKQYIIHNYCLLLNRQIPVEQFKIDAKEVEKVFWMPLEEFKEMMKTDKTIRIPYVPTIHDELFKRLEEQIEKSKDCER